MARDDRSAGSVESDTQGGEPGVEGVVVSGREQEGVLDARRERLACGAHGTPSCGSRAIRSRRRSRRHIVSHRQRWFGLPRSIRFTAGFPRAPRG